MLTLLYRFRFHALLALYRVLHSVAEVSLRISRAFFFVGSRLNRVAWRKVHPGLSH